MTILIAAQIELLIKGMVGRTIADQTFIREIKAILSSNPQDTTIIVAIGIYGRFIYNYANSDQTREFLALGGILKSEIVYKINRNNFEKWLESLNLTGTN